jgi:uncharacterized protein (TIGR02246 family)
MVLALLMAAAAATPSFSVEVAARPAAAVVDRFHAALRQGDAKDVLALMAEDALVYESGHVEQGKAEYQASHLAADMEFARAVKAVTTARSARAQGNFAWIASQGSSSGKFRGKPVASATTETMVLRRAGGQWRIVHIHWSSASY